MFTGIIEEIGIVQSIHEKVGGRQFTIEAKAVLGDAALGSSIAVNGTCLTVESFSKNHFQIFAVPETLALTNLGILTAGSRVNLERALRADSRLGGHIVQGHVEGLAEVVQIEKNENFWEITLRYRSPYLIPKGSVTLDGISLTLHELRDDQMRIQIIPETLRKTNIVAWQIGSRINIETDYLVKAMDHVFMWREKEKNK